MTQWLKQSTAVTVKIGPFLDETDGKTAETSLTISQADVRLSMNGGNMAQKTQSDAATHDEIGWYDCSLDSTDTGTLGRLVLMVHESGALPVWHEFMVVPANVWDSMFSTDKLQVDAVEISGDSTAADNAELMFDGTGYVGGATKLSVDAVAISGDATAADRLEAMLDAMPSGAVVDDNDPDPTTTAFETNLSEATSDHYNGAFVVFTSGSLLGQSRLISDYDGTSKVLTVATAFTEAPAAADAFIILGRSE